LGSDARSIGILKLLRPRCKKLTDFADQLRPFFEPPVSYDHAAVKKHLSMPGTKEHLLALKSTYETAEWNEASLEKVLRELADQRTIKAGVLIQGARIAMTGGMVSPGLFEMLVLLGREIVVGRLELLAKTL
jgi:glutamyl-tRNA synthetase